MKFTNPSIRTQRSFSALAQALAVLVLAPALARAATISKADNTDNLNLTTSWAGAAVPGAADIAQWTSTVAAGNTTASLGADLSWLGIKIVGPGGAVTLNPGNTLTVGASGIDLSAATKDLVLNCGLALRNTGQHSWKAASGRSLNVAGTFSRAGTMVDFNSFNAAATLSGLANDASGILGHWATTGTGTGNTLNYVKSTSGAISAFTGQTPATSSTDLSNVTDANVNYSLASTTGGVTLAGSLTANTLRVTSSTTGGTGDVTTLTVNAPNSITLNGLIGVGTGRTAISGTGNLVIGASRELVVNWTVGQNRIYCPIVDNSGGSSSVTLNNRGGGEQWYGTDGAVGTINTYTGGTTINATTAFTLDCWQTSFGSGPITVNGNGVAINLYYRHAALVSNSITVNGAGGYLRTLGGTFAGPITLNANTITMSNISGNMGGVGGVNQNLAGTYTFSGTNTYTGPTTVTLGTLKAGRASVPNVSGAFGLNSAVTMANAATAILDLNGYNTQIGSLAGVGSGGTVTNSSAVTATTLTIGGNNTSTAYVGLISGTKLSLCKIGSGTLTLAGANTYGGNTAVSAGTFSLSPTVAGGNLADGADVYLTTGAVLNLNTGGTTTDTIRSLYIDGVPQAAGVWGADGSGSEHTSTLITGTGKLNVTTFGAATSYSISGTVTENGLALAGVSVTDGTRTTTTAADGTYTIANVPDGITYTVTPSKSGYTFTPATLSLMLSGANQSGNQFTATVASGGHSYDTWKTGSFANAFTDTIATHDPDGDGLSNFQEFAFGLDPTSGASCTPVTPLIGNEFTYTRNANSSLSYSVESSTDLTIWNPAITTELIGAPNTKGVQIVTVTVQDTPVNGKLFLRVRAE